MAYPEILRDKRKAAIPQLWDGSNWRPLKGTKDGHQQTQLVGPDGQPIGSENPLEVRVRELEEKLDAMNQLLQSGDAKMQLTGRIEVLAELEHVHVPANSIVDIVPRDRRIGYTELRGGFYVNDAVRGNYELRIRNLQPQANSHHPYSFRTIVALENDYWGSGRSLGIESVRWGVEFRNLNDFDITLRSVVVMGVRG